MIRQKIFMAIASLVLCACSSFHLNAQTVTGTLRDSLTGDQNSNGIANPGDSIAYKAKLKNTSGSGATGVQYNNPTPANTQLGTNTRTSALARNDVGAVAFNASLTGGNVLSNDFGIPTPSVLTYGPTANPGATSAGNTGTTNGGGSVVVTSGGALTYTPLTGYTGNDQFGYIAGNGNLPNNSATMLISVGNPATASNDSYNAVGNVSITLNAALGVKANDGGDATVVETVQGSAGNVGVSTNTANNGQITLQADGSFTYNPPPGFEGTDNFTYTVDNGFNTPASATVSITVAGMIWFVNNNVGTNGDGRLSSPFNILPALNGINNGLGNNPAAGDNIYLYGGGADYAGGIVLLNNQKLLGNSAMVTLAGMAGVTPPSYSAPLPSGGTRPVIVNAIGNGISLNSVNGANTIWGMEVHNCLNSAVSGTNFGTLTCKETAINTNKQGLFLSNGAIAPFSDINSYNSTGGTNNITLNSISGNLPILTAGAMSGATGDAFVVTGGSVTLSWPGSISQASNAAMVKVSGGHTGTLTFTGTLSATNGTGLQFDNADGAYNFNGTNTMNGGQASIAIFNGSSGNFTFSSGTSITSPSAGAPPVNIIGGTATVTYNGNITQATGSSPMVSVSGGHATGIVAFNTGTLNATNGTGLQFDNADGTYNFNGTTTLNGGGAQVNIINASAGSFSFSNATSITGSTDTAFAIVGGTASVTYAGNITQANNFSMVSVSGGHSSGTVTFQAGTLNATNGNGLQFENADGTYNFTGTTTLNGGDAGIDILTGSGGSFVFSNAPITNPTGHGINISSSTCTVNHTGAITHNSSGNRAVTVNGCTSPNITINGNINLTGSVTSGINVSVCSGGSVSLAGNITSNVQQPAITVNSNSGGAVITFSGSSKSLSTALASAVLLTLNTGATINFSNGGLVINTTNGTGFSATGGGTITVTKDFGVFNTITSTTGTALNVVSTTIGAANLNFKTISAGTASAGPANGIVLNSTGSLGGLIVTGDANSSVGGNSSGGIIQKTSGIGISLTSTINPSFTNVNIQNTGASGVGGTLVINFTLQNSTINNSGTANVLQASNVGFNTQSAGTENNLSGVVTISGNSLTNAWYQGIDIFNFAGTISNATISNNTITSGTTTGGNFPASVGSGIRFIGFGSASTIANITKATINNNTITNFPGGVGLQVQGGNANSSGAPLGTYGTPGISANVITISNNTISGQSPAVQTGGEGMIALVNGVGQGHFSISGNTVRYNKGTSISASAFGNANVELDVVSNTVISNNIFASQGIGVGTSTTSGFGTNSPHLTAKITGNNVSQTDGNGILAVARDASFGVLDVSIKNNIVAAPLTGVRQGIRIDAGNATGDNDVCLDISGNTSASSVGQPAALGIGLRKQGTSTTINAFGVEGMGATSTPGVESYINGLNPAGGGTLLISASSGFTNCASAPN